MSLFSKDFTVSTQTLLLPFWSSPTDPVAVFLASLQPPFSSPTLLAPLPLRAVLLLLGASPIKSSVTHGGIRPPCCPPVVLASWCSRLWGVPSRTESAWPKHGRSDGGWLLSLALKRLRFLLCSLELRTPVKSNPCTNTQAVLCRGRGKAEPECQPAMGASQFGRVLSTSHQAP